MLKKPDQETLGLMRAAASKDPLVRRDAQWKLAEAMSLPLRDGILSGNITDGIFQPYELPYGQNPELPIDLLNPGEEDDFIAWTNPGNGRIPEKQVESDYITLQTYGIASSVDMLLRYLRDANWNVMARALQVMEAGFTRKLNNDGWYTLLGAAADRNILVYDADAANGFFSKRLVSLMKVVMARNGGGNASSLRKRRLTDLYLSPEALEDIRNWGLDQVDEITRREIYTAADGGITRIFSVNLHEVYELGTGNQYQLFFQNQLSGTMPAGDVEIVLGIDATGGNLLMPMREDLVVEVDETMRRAQKIGWYGTMEAGFAVLDNRDVILGSI